MFLLMSLCFERTDAAARFWRIVGFSPRLGHWVARPQWHNALRGAKHRVASCRSNRNAGYQGDTVQVRLPLRLLIDD